MFCSERGSQIEGEERRRGSQRINGPLCYSEIPKPTLSDYKYTRQSSQMGTILHFVSIPSHLIHSHVLKILSYLQLTSLSIFLLYCSFIDVDNESLDIGVWHNHLIGKPGFKGKVSIPLNDLPAPPTNNDNDNSNTPPNNNNNNNSDSNNTTITQWYPLHGKDKDLNKKPSPGELYLSLTYDTYLKQQQKQQ